MSVPDPLDDLLSGYSFELPNDRIAQHPPRRRDEARLLVVDRSAGGQRDLSFQHLPDLLDPGDLLVVNDVRVSPARLYTRKSTGGLVEVLVLHPLADGARLALVRGSAKIQPGTNLRVTRRGDGALGPSLIIGDVLGAGRSVRVADPTVKLSTVLEDWGEMPLPPYIAREQSDPRDRDRYQTVFAREGGAAAAPTAGLHFTAEVLQRLEDRGVGLARVTLDVGAGTFRPVQTERLSDHPMHAERYVVPPETAAAVEDTERRGGRVVAVGTTSCRSLESWHRLGRPQDGLPRETRLFLRPGDPPQLDLGLITNFHLPKSTLIALVASFLGRERTLALYRHALDAGYRFYSYGDASILL